MAEKIYIGKKVILINGEEHIWVSLSPDALLLRLGMFKLEEIELDGNKIVKRLEEIKSKFQNDGKIK